MITKSFWGKTKSGKEAHLYTITNRNKMSITVSDFGAVLVSLFVPDCSGQMTDVVLGYDELCKYEDNFDMLGTTVGRNVNRIENASFKLGGKTYRLAVNENNNNIHSSMENGFHKVLWRAEAEGDNGIAFCYESPDGENGFPGRLRVRVVYSLTDDNEMTITYQGRADRDTVFNPTNHSYFNLDGIQNGGITDTLVQIDADAYTPIKSGIIPTGEIKTVCGTPFDFRTLKRIAEDLGTADEQLKLAGGYDHNFVLNNWGQGIRFAAKAIGKKSGIVMEIFTDLPGLQFYTGNTTRDVAGKGGCLITKYSGFCMEPQFFPNSINISDFPAPVLKKDTDYETVSKYRFGIMKEGNDE